MTAKMTEGDPFGPPSVFVRVHTPADLVFDPTLACWKVRAEGPAATALLAQDPPNTERDLDAWLPLPPPPRVGVSGGQGLLLSRTMLSNHEVPYVGRFACDWHRLATTDPGWNPWRTLYPGSTNDA